MQIDDLMKTYSECKRFLVTDCWESDQRITIFCSDLQLELLCKSERIGVDGTFKSCPSLYAQIYIIMGYYLAECFPVAFVLLGGKKKKTYARMITELKKAALSIKLEFRPIEIMIDFEKGAIEASSEQFPSA